MMALITSRLNQVVKIVHAAKMDVQIFWERTQEAPCNVFDTQVRHRRPSVRHA